MNRLTFEVVQNSQSYKSPLGDYLDLRKLGLESIQNLGSTLDYFSVIDLSDNNIQTIQMDSVLLNLKHLILNNNQLTELTHISESFPNLSSISLINNRISNLEEIRKLSSLKFLDTIILKNNPITNQKDYIESISRLLPQARVIDFQKIKNK